MRTLHTLPVVVMLAALADAVAAAPATRPICISGIYPSLAALSDAKSECGIGAVVPWAGSLWYVSYPAHYGDGKLYQVGADLKLHLRPESIGGTHAARMIHRESEQLIIGPYFIDKAGTVRACGVHARITAAMRHLTDPKNRIYYFDMEGGFFEVDVKTLVPTTLPTVQKLGVTGTHGKGGYTAEGRIVIANNGRGGALAEGDGQKWALVEHKKFCEVTGPNGISPVADEHSPDGLLWATGWDDKSVILKVLYKGAWHTYRLPKSSYSHDPDHGWFTEWPRIREVGGGRFLMDFHGMFFDFPKDFAPGKTGGLRPIATHLRMIPDFCDWNGRLVLASDDTSVMGNPLGGQPQSNLWFGSLEEVKRWGRPAGWGGVWMGDAVKAGVPSDPFLIDGFEQRMLYLAHRADGEVEYAIEIDVNGAGKWEKHKTLRLPAVGWTYLTFPREFRASWVRLTASRDCVASAYFHFGSTGHEAGGGFREPGAGRVDGTLLPVANRLWFLAKTGLFEIDQDMKLVKRDEGDAKQIKEQLAALEPKPEPFAPSHTSYTVGWDEASVIVKAGRRTYRLPKGDAAFDKPEWAQSRHVREVITERYLLNAHGIFYEVPREDFAGIRPVTTHNRFISDFCTWRGLFVMSGIAAGQKDEHCFYDPSGQTGLWFGAVDDLWKMGKPRGVGGPWQKTAVKAGQASDPYLMTGFDRKRLELSHASTEEVEFKVEVDFLKNGTWRTYQAIKAPAGQTVRHEFPAGFSAHWVRVTANRDCVATATFVYE